MTTKSAIPKAGSWTRLLSGFRLSFPSLPLLSAVVLAYATASGVLVFWFGTNAPIWLGNGIGVVALLRQPRNTWWAYLCAFWLADAFVIATFGTGPAPLLALVDVLEIALAAWLVRFRRGDNQPLFSGDQLVRLGAACVLAPVFSSSLGAALLWWSDSAPFLAGWETWYAASALGLLLVTPCLLCWTDERLRHDELAPGGGLLSMTVAGLLLLLALAVFSFHSAVVFILFPALLLATWYRGLLGATTGGVIVSAIGMWATLDGRGPIAHLVLPSASMIDLVQAMQLFAAALLFSTVPIAVLIARLRHASEARADFLAAMSHEIRTPLTAVLGMVDLMDAETLSKRQRSYVETMRSSGRHLLNVINDILDFSRIESGHLELESIDFSLPKVLERTRTLLQPAAVEGGIELHIESELDMPEVFRGDPVRIKQVLLNLVGNAIKFTNTGSVKVRVRHTRADQSGRVLVHFEVADTGIGMQPDQVQRLFTSFMQADRSISRRYGGTGLGLAICKRLVEAMGGKIDAQSEVGQGSVFRVHLPLQMGDPAGLARPGGLAPAESAPQRILIAEDVPINRDILQAVLARQGHQLVFAQNGAEALVQVERQEFDLVLMDVQMPVMGGVETTQRIRRLEPPRRSVPIIGLTADVMARERDQYLAAGMDDCLTKPIDWDQLYAAIRKHGRPAQPRPAVASPVDRPEPWVDEGRMSKLRRVMAPEGIRELMATGMQDYENYCRSIAAPDTDPQRRREDAHKLRGSASTLGLVALAELAGRVEACAEGPHVANLVDELQQALVRTRAELIARGLLPPPQGI